MQRIVELDHDAVEKCGEASGGEVGRLAQAPHVTNAFGPLEDGAQGSAEARGAGRAHKREHFRRQIVRDVVAD